MRYWRIVSQQHRTLQAVHPYRTQYWRIVSYRSSPGRFRAASLSLASRRLPIHHRDADCIIIFCTIFGLPALAQADGNSTIFLPFHLVHYESYLKQWVPQSSLSSCLVYTASFWLFVMYDSVHDIPWPSRHTLRVS